MYFVFSLCLIKVFCNNFSKVIEKIKVFEILWNYANGICRKEKKKVHAYKALVVPTLAYASECWTLKKEDRKRKLHSLEMNCLRRMIGVTRREDTEHCSIRN